MKLFGDLASVGVIFRVLCFVLLYASMIPFNALYHTVESVMIKCVFNFLLSVRMNLSLIAAFGSLWVEYSSIL